MDIRTKNTKFEIVEIDKQVLIDLWLLINKLEDEGEATRDDLYSSVELRSAIDDFADFFSLDLEAEKKKRLIKDIPF